MFADQTFKGDDALYWQDHVADENDNMQMVYKEGYFKVVGWERIEKLQDHQPNLWGEKGISPAASVQGMLGTCWFLSAASALAEYPERILKLFENRWYP